MKPKLTKEDLFNLRWSLSQTYPFIISCIAEIINQAHRKGEKYLPELCFEQFEAFRKIIVIHQTFEKLGYRVGLSHDPDFKNTQWTDIYYHLHPETREAWRKREAEIVEESSYLTDDLKQFQKKRKTL